MTARPRLQVAVLLLVQFCRIRIARRGHSNVPGVVIKSQVAAQLSFFFLCRFPPPQQAFCTGCQTGGLLRL